MTNNECLVKVENFNKDVTLAKPSQNVVDEIYSKFIQVHKDEVVKYLQVHNLKIGRKGCKSKNKPFGMTNSLPFLKKHPKQRNSFVKTVNTG